MNEPPKRPIIGFIAVLCLIALIASILVLLVKYSSEKRREELPRKVVPSETEKLEDSPQVKNESEWGDELHYGGVKTTIEGE